MYKVSLVVYILVSHKNNNNNNKKPIHINSKVPLDNLVMLWGWAGGLLPGGGPALLLV